MFTAGARAKPPPGVEQGDVENHDQQQGQVGEGRVLEQDVTDHRDIGEQGDANRRKLACSDGIAVEQVRRQTRGQDDQHRTGDDLIHAIADRECAVQQAHQAANHQRCQNTDRQAGVERPAIGRYLGNEGGEGAGQHHPLDADIDDAGALAQDAAHRAQGQRDGRAQREVQRTDPKQQPERGDLLKCGDTVHQDDQSQQSNGAQDFKDRFLSG